ncbi:MAG: threonine synthase [Rhodospirillaceae bacterium]
MRYISTRGEAPALSFDDVLLAGLAPDGGLYVPEAVPVIDNKTWDAWRGLSYPELAAAVMRPFVGGALPDAEIASIAAEAYRGFDHRAVAPLKQIDTDLWIMELFHGPTLAFKDMAMQVLGRLFDSVLTRRSRRVTIVGATSGDTGSAAIEACRDREAVDVFILHPHERVSEVQRRQMTTVTSSNVFNIAIKGTFDDCQDLLKAMFADVAFRDRVALSAVNSINWARVMAQVVYYVWAALRLGAPDRAVGFSVPTGNFGNIFAGYVAKAMGLPIEQLIVGSNRNDILTRFFSSGTMEMTEVVPTISPSMDIQISSNFERLLFDMLGRDGDAVRTTMNRFRQSGRFEVAEMVLARSRATFSALSLDDDATRAAIRAEYRATGEILDPHSVIGVAAARARAKTPGVPVVALATAHPAKFGQAVAEATGVTPKLPARLADLMERPERVTILPNDLKTVQDYVLARARAAGGRA